MTLKITFELRDEEEAFCFLDHLDLVELAVSLGGTESLAQHPAAMTHAGVPPEAREAYSVTDGLIRLSVGVEDLADLQADLERAFEAVKG